MALFSERNGYVSPRTTLQIESMDENLRVAVYNVFYACCGEYQQDTLQEDVFRSVWCDYWHKSLDSFPRGYWYVYAQLKTKIMDGEWFEVYDLCEFFLSRVKHYEQGFVSPWGSYSNRGEHSLYDLITQVLNQTLLHEGSGYRIVNGLVTQITNEQELESIEQSMVVQDPFSGVRMHIGSALEHFSKRPNADYRNTVKEAVSAVESAAQVVVGDSKATLSKALKQMRSQRKLHPALADGWGKLYAFAGDEGGIRHAAYTDEVRVDFSLAKYMLISCSAFANYLIELYNEDGE